MRPGITAQLALVVACTVAVPAWAQDAGSQGADVLVDGGVGGVVVAELPDGGADDAAVPSTDAAAASSVEDRDAPLVSLPPAAPTPEIAPIVVGRGAVKEPPPVSTEERPFLAIKTLAGLLTLLAFAYLGGHPRVLALERRIGISQVVTAGLPFVVLGMVARAPAVEVLNDAVLADLSPLLRIGLGSIGFVSGFRFSSSFRSAPGGDVVRMAATVTAIPFLIVASISGSVLLLLSGELSSEAIRDPVFLRDALILGTAGAMTAKTSLELFRVEDAEGVLSRIVRLEELAGVIGLAVIAAYFRPREQVTWQLPGTAWLLLTVGLGVTLGLLAYTVFRQPRESPEFVLLTLGSIAFMAGVAGYLRLSPVVVAFVAGTCLALAPGSDQLRIRAALRRLERPVYFLSLIVIGALWQVDEPVGWVLVPVFTFSRLLGRYVGTSLGLRTAGLQLSGEDRQALAISPTGPLAIAIVVNAQLLYPGGSISPIVAAVVGGAILTEILVQLASRRTPSSGPPGAPSPRAPSPVWSDAEELR